MKHSLAAAYAMKRRKYAKGGELEICVGPECKGCGAGDCYAKGGDVNGVHKLRKPYENPNPAKDKKDPIVEGVDFRGNDMVQSKESKMRAKHRYQEDRLASKREGYADGGDVEDEEHVSASDKGFTNGLPGKPRDGAVEAGFKKMFGGMENEAKASDMKKYENLMPKPSDYAEGGEVEEDGHDLVSAIMRKRHGSDVNHADHESADFEQYPDDEKLDFHYTGENSGDEDGNAAEDEDQKDMISQIMKSRKKKDKNPRPA